MTNQNDIVYPEYLTYILPCLNEADTLPNCIRQINNVIKQLDKPASILVVDNGSTDNSREIAMGLGARVVDAPVRGYGSAIISGCSIAKGRYLIIGDSDGSYDFSESIQMVDELEKGYDLVLGSRFKGKILPHAMPFMNRYIGNPILTRILNIFFRSHITDAHSGLRAFSHLVYKQLQLASTGMELASEMIIKAAILGLRIKEVPITLSPDGRSRKSHLRPWRDGWRHLKLLLIYSPQWLYFIPGSFMFIAGFLLNLALNIIPPDHFIYFNTLFFGTHWTVPATLLAVLGLQMNWLGLFSLFYSVNSKLYPAPRWFSKVKNLLKLERSLITGLIFTIFGFMIESYIFLKWISLDFGELNEVRLGIFGMMWINLGIEIITNGFFLDLMNSHGKAI
jgi:glycosyltransferase involved in cell wall biosynthesis